MLLLVIVIVIDWKDARRRVRASNPWTGRRPSLQILGQNGARPSRSLDKNGARPSSVVVRQDRLRARA